MHRLQFRFGPRPSARRVGAGVVLLLLVTTFDAGVARAATFIVNSAADTTDGTCAAEPGGCTLREAIEAVVAAPGRDTIVFDPATFPAAGPAPAINLLTALPVIADPAGTVVDGKGAMVTLNAAGQPRGLTFATAAGVPLAKVTVANFRVVNAAGSAIAVCGGELPACDDDVTGTLIQTVAIGGGQNALSVRGRVVRKTRIVAVSVVNHSITGISVNADSDLLGARVEGSTVIGGFAGILLSSDDRTVGVAVVDSIASRSANGIVVQGGETTGTKISDVVTALNSDSGIRVSAEGPTNGTTITNAVASALGGTGVAVASVNGSRGLTIRNVTAEGGRPGGDGVGVSRPVDGAAFQNLVLVGNMIGLDLSDTGTGVTHATLSGVVSADNDFGIIVNGGATVVKKSHVGANEGPGLIFTGTAGGFTVEKNRVMGNGNNGIVTDASANRIQKNVALGNSVDLVDDDATCDANVWQKNVFRIGSAPCIH